VCRLNETLSVDASGALLSGIVIRVFTVVVSLLYNSTLAVMIIEDV